MRRKNLDLLIAIFIALLNIAWTQIPYHLLPVSILLALPLILFLPGYAVTQILFRRRLIGQFLNTTSELIVHPHLKLEHPVGNADLLVLSIGLSLTIDVLLGFGLNIVPIGLTALSWTVSLGLITMICALLAALMRRKDVVVSGGTRKLRPRVTTSDMLLFGLSIVLTGLAIWLSLIRPLSPQPSFTQLWMLPTNQVNNNCTVSIGVQNFETSTLTYRVVLKVNGSQFETWSSISLRPQQKWMRSVQLKPSTTSSIFVEAQLYRTDQPDIIYRNVHLTFHSIITGSNGGYHEQCTLDT